MGNFLLCGPYDNHQGGLIIASVSSEAMLQGILSEDVFYDNGLASYQVTAFRMRFVNMPVLSKIL